MKLLKKVFEHWDKISVVIEQGLSSGGNFIIPLFVINIYNEEWLAEFVLVQSVYVYFLSVCRSIFLNPYVYLQRLGVDENIFYKKINFYYYLIILFTVTVIAICVLCITNLCHYWIYVVFFVVSLGRDYLKNVFIAELRFKSNLILGIYCFFALCALMFLSIQMNLMFTDFLLILSGFYFIAIVYCFVREYGTVTIKELRQFNSFSKNISFGRWSFYNSILQFIMTQGLIYTLLMREGDYAVAIYGIFLSISNMFNPIITSVNNYIAPVMKRLVVEKGVLALKQYYKNTRVIVLGSLSVLIVLSIVLSRYLIMIYDSAYLEFRSGLILILICVIFSAYNFINSRYLSALDYPQIVFLTGIASLVGCFIIMIFVTMIPWYLWMGLYLLTIKVMSTIYFEIYIRKNRV